MVDQTKAAIGELTNPTVKSTASKSNKKLDNFPGPFPNKFKKYSNMSYSVSVYIQSPKHYSAMINSGKKTVEGLTLLFQSGGINDVKTTHGAKRSQYFQNDFYIDNVQMESLVSGTATGAPNNTYELNFTVTEPMGLTFLENLNNAVREYNIEQGISDEDINFIAQTYLMVIRFYGYDENGLPKSGDEIETTDPAASVEKFIPFMFTGITFQMNAAQVEYSCTAVCPQSHIATDKIHGTVPKTTEIQGTTLEEILNGEKNSLASALNSLQKELKDACKYEVADTYSFELDSNLASAKLNQPGTLAISKTGIGKATPLESVGGKKSKTKAEKRIFTTTAGISIIKMIDTLVRTSTYISDQFSEQQDQNEKGEVKFKKKDKEKALKWFKVSPRIKIGEYDKARNDYSYHITFVISEYEVQSVGTQSALFQGAECFNVHKEYDFWFTGLNTEVLDFKQDYNFMYFTSFGGSHKRDPNDTAAVQNNRRVIQRNYYQVNSTDNTQGGVAGNTEQAANAASILYSPADQANASIDIVGDPDWITQSEIFYAPKANRERSPVFEDGSINSDIAEIFFTVNFNTVVDYDLNTGLADVTKNNVGGDFQGKGSVSQYSLIYRANTITTQLQGGRFVQKLEGTIVFIPEKCVKAANKEASRDNTKKETTTAKTTKAKTKTAKADACLKAKNRVNGKLAEPKESQTNNTTNKTAKEQVKEKQQLDLIGSTNVASGIFGEEPGGA